MPKDYAPKARRSKESRGVGKGSREESTRPVGWPGFVLGLGCGVVATLLAGQLPALWTERALPSPAPPAAAEPAADPAPTYEFIDRLPQDEVVTNVVPYTPPEASAAAAEDAAVETAPRQYLLQAASFRNRDDADAMRADLLLEGMAVAISAVPRPAGGAWHRVLVGPFAGEQEMRRALSRLREKDIPAMPILHSP